MKRLDKKSRISTSFEEMGCKAMDPKKYSELNSKYVQATQHLFKQSDRASMKSSKKMGKMRLG